MISRIADKVSNRSLSPEQRSANISIVLDALVAAGVDPNARDSQGVSVLYGAASGGHVEVVRYLLEVGVDPGSQTVFGWAPLHWAAADGFIEVVRLLVEAGANVNPLSDTSKTPLDLARTHKDNPNRGVTVRYLEEAGAMSAKEVLAARATKRLEEKRSGASWAPTATSPVAWQTNQAIVLEDDLSSEEEDADESDSDMVDYEGSQDEDHLETIWQHIGQSSSDEATSEIALEY